MLHTSYIELSQSALQNNIRFLRQKAQPARYSMVIKANAYGHGIECMVPMVEACGVDHFSVFSVAEAQRVHEIKQENCHVMIMCFVDDDYLEWVIERGISFFVFSLDRLKKVAEISRKCRLPARIHVELETGMHRTGFTEDLLGQVIGLFRENRERFVLQGLCSHLAGAENLENFPRVQDQIRTFHRLGALFDEAGLSPRYRHLACSAGLFNFPDSRLDLVRIGISNYGFWPDMETKVLNLGVEGLSEDPLQRVLSWKSKVLSVNRVPEGAYVSYGTSFMTARDSKIATIPVGYGYGFSRNLSNLGHVLVHGKRVRVIGSVNMNMVLLDVTDLPHVAVGDEVVLIGRQGDRQITVGSFSDMNNSMNYELLTRLPGHIPRYRVE